MMGRRAVRLALVAAALLVSAGSLRAQCAFTGAAHVTWPSVNPVWDFCFRRPSLASAGNGAGLELSEVKYNGTLVIFQAHIPILNVKYVANLSGCGGGPLCYRDWFDSEQPFECAPTVSAGICSGTTTPAKTVCDACTDGTGFECRDVGSFNGVAVESLADRLKLTAQTEAGWYRYIPVWEFFADGTIQAKFVATSVDHACVAYTHDHHAYYRLDLDVGGKAGNYVDEVLSGGGTQRVTTERNFVDTSPARSKWRVAGPTSPYFVEVARNAGDGAAGDPLPIANDFPVADGWVLAYNSAEISDYTNTTSGCAANINPWDNNQNVDGADIVLWVRAGSLHEGEGSNQSAHCAMAGPTIRVLPVSPPAGTKFNTVAPCRIVDTRDPAGPYGAPPLAAGVPRSFVLAGQCGVPPTAKSVAVNLTVVAPSQTGNLIAFPTGGVAPPTSVLNFSAGQTRANNAVLGLSAGGAVSLQSNVPSGNTQVVLDVTGWFE
jgi:hypothetical protein